MKTVDQSHCIRTTSFLEWCFGLCLFSVIGVGGVVWLWEHSMPWAGHLSKLHWLRIREVEIECGWPVTRSQVKSWLPPLEGVSLLAINPRALIRLVENREWIDTVSVQKQYPDRIRIRIETKKPEAVGLFGAKGVYLDWEGNPIAALHSLTQRSVNLPIISHEHPSGMASAWEMKRVLALPKRFQLETGFVPSEVVLMSYPHLKIFLASPKLEIHLNMESWETQLPQVALLLLHPPKSIGSIKSIFLVPPKKAIVSSSISN